MPASGHGLDQGYDQVLCRQDWHSSSQAQSPGYAGRLHGGTPTESLLRQIPCGVGHGRLPIVSRQENQVHLGTPVFPLENDPTPFDDFLDESETPMASPHGRLYPSTAFPGPSPRATSDRSEDTYRAQPLEITSPNVSSFVKSSNVSSLAEATTEYAVEGAVHRGRTLQPRKRPTARVHRRRTPIFNAADVPEDLEMPLVNTTMQTMPENRFLPSIAAEEISSGARDETLDEYFNDGPAANLSDHDWQRGQRKFRHTPLLGECFQEEYSRAVPSSSSAPVEGDVVREPPKAYEQTLMMLEGRDGGRQEEFGHDSDERPTIIQIFEGQGRAATVKNPNAEASSALPSNDEGPGAESTAAEPESSELEPSQYPGDFELVWNFFDDQPRDLREVVAHLSTDTLDVPEYMPSPTDPVNPWTDDSSSNARDHRQNVEDFLPMDQSVNQARELRTIATQRRVGRVNAFAKRPGKLCPPLSHTTQCPKSPVKNNEPPQSQSDAPLSLSGGTRIHDLTLGTRASEEHPTEDETFLASLQPSIYSPPFRSTQNSSESQTFAPLLQGLAEDLPATIAPTTLLQEFDVIEGCNTARQTVDTGTEPRLRLQLQHTVSFQPGVERIERRGPEWESPSSLSGFSPKVHSDVFSPATGRSLLYSSNSNLTTITQTSPTSGSFFPSTGNEFDISVGVTGDPYGIVCSPSAPSSNVLSNSEGDQTNPRREDLQEQARPTISSQYLADPEINSDPAFPPWLAQNLASYQHLNELGTPLGRPDKGKGRAEPGSIESAEECQPRSSSTVAELPCPPMERTKGRSDSIDNTLSDISVAAAKSGHTNRKREAHQGPQDNCSTLPDVSSASSPMDLALEIESAASWDSTDLSKIPTADPVDFLTRHPYPLPALPMPDPDHEQYRPTSPSGSAFSSNVESSPTRKPKSRRRLLESLRVLGQRAINPGSSTAGSPMAVSIEAKASDNSVPYASAGRGDMSNVYVSPSGHIAFKHKRPERPERHPLRDPALYPEPLTPQKSRNERFFDPDGFPEVIY
ncbi:MAG: hypothetical protein M1833_001518 [Piccolia ochrophora]|nr:MAG: hypothetical protein M1833_001518 [Piccolia ochrophora]